VKVEEKTGDTWLSPTGVSTVAKVDSADYVAAGTDGELGDLRLVTKTIGTPNAPHLRHSAATR
jgi:hypothetical protein